MNSDQLISTGYKTIIGFSSYLVNNEGNIYSLKSHNFRTPCRDKNGFFSITIYSDTGKRQSFFIHRLVAKYFVDNPHRHNWVRHKDNNRQNNHHSNLEYCKYNIVFQNKKGRNMRFPKISIERRIDAFRCFFSTYSKGDFTKIYRANPRAFELAVIEYYYSHIEDLNEELLIYYKYCEGASYEELNKHGLTNYKIRTSIFKSRENIIKIIEEYKDKVTFPQLNLKLSS